MVLRHLGSFWVFKKKWLKYPSRDYFSLKFSLKIKEQIPPNTSLKPEFAKVVTVASIIGHYFWLHNGVLVPDGAYLTSILRPVQLSLKRGCNSYDRKKLMERPIEGPFRIVGLK